MDIDHFRGIETLRWVVPRRGFCALIGPGDATKSTVLTAIERALSDRYSVPFSDTDFHDADLDYPISIRVTVDDLTDELMAVDSFGHHLCGITDDGALLHDPHNASNPCVVVELRVESDLEPQWLFWRPATESETDEHVPVPVRAKLRARFGVYRIDERVDAHLRWSRTSALGRLTEARAETKGNTKSVLTQASRAARDAVALSIGDDLIQLSAEVQQRVERLGTAKFTALRPGLDLSLTNAQGNLALYDGQVPLTNHGLGTRRLTGAAAQQLAHAGSALLLVDEVEYGLEPHRLAHLLRELRQPESYAQVFVTTHSPTALQHLLAAELVTVRTDGSGTTVMRTLSEPAQMQGVVEAAPAAFLSRLVIVCEGKTEVGLVTAQLAAWDSAPSPAVPSAVLGVSVVNGGGGHNAVRLAGHLRDVGYPVVVVIDSDVTAVVRDAEKFEAAGGIVIRWDDGLNTEAAVCAELDATALAALVEVAVAVAVDAYGDQDVARQAIANQLQTKGAPLSDLDVRTWINAEFGVENARNVVAQAAVTKGSAWFKSTAGGRSFGGFVAAQQVLVGGPMVDGSMASRFGTLRNAVYATGHTDLHQAGADASVPVVGPTPDLT